MADNELINDVGMLKGQVSALMIIAQKMDIIIDKLVEQHDRQIVKIYDDMNNQRLETDADIKEIHQRIDTVLEKMQASEKSILEKIDGLRACITEHNKEEKKQLETILQWKWMVAGGIIAFSWLISHVNLDTIVHSFK